MVNWSGWRIGLALFGCLVLGLIGGSEVEGQSKTLSLGGEWKVLAPETLGAKVEEARKKQDVMGLVSLAALLRLAPDDAARKVASTVQPEALLDEAAGMVKQKGAPRPVLQALAQGYEALGQKEKGQQVLKAPTPKQRMCAYEYVYVCNAWGCQYAYRYICY